MCLSIIDIKGVMFFLSNEYTLCLPFFLTSTKLQCLNLLRLCDTLVCSRFSSFCSSLTVLAPFLSELMIISLSWLVRVPKNSLYAFSILDFEGSLFLCMHLLDICVKITYVVYKSFVLTGMWHALT